MWVEKYRPKNMSDIVNQKRDYGKSIRINEKSDRDA